LLDDVVEEGEVAELDLVEDGASDPLDFVDNVATVDVLGTVHDVTLAVVLLARVDVEG
jgi:hypothetical protein